MKKFITSLGILLTLASCAPLHIVLNRTDKSGAHIICTSDVELFGEFEVAMGMKTAKKDTMVGLFVTCSKKASHGLFSKDDRLVVSFADGQKLEIPNVYERKFDKDVETGYTTDTYYDNVWGYTYSPWTDGVYLTPYTVRTFVPRAYTYTISHSYALYFVTREQLHMMMEKEISDVTVEIEDQDCHMNNPESFGSRIRELYNYIRENSNAVPSDL